MCDIVLIVFNLFVYVLVNIIFNFMLVVKKIFSIKLGLEVICK